MRHPRIKDRCIPLIRNGWKFCCVKNGLFYYKSIQDCQSYDLDNFGLKIHNFSLELKQSKTPPAAWCWIISTLVRHYVFFNPRFCKSWDCPNMYSYTSGNISYIGFKMSLTVHTVRVNKNSNATSTKLRPHCDKVYGVVLLYLRPLKWLLGRL